MEHAQNSLFLDLGFLLLALFLVFLNGFFVAAEFAMVKLRSTQAETLADKHGFYGQTLQKVHQNLDIYLSACQLGITLASLGLGWVGEPAFAALLEKVFSFLPANLLHIISFAFAFFTISFLHIVLGELAPKSLAIANPAKLSLITATPLYIFYHLTYPLIYLLNTSSNFILSFISDRKNSEHTHNYSEEELKIILNSSYHNDEENNSLRVLASASELSELEVVDWANSKEDLIFIKSNHSLSEILTIFKQYKYSRFPVFDVEEEEFVGILHIKDLLIKLSDTNFEQANFDLDSLIRPIEKVHRNLDLTKLLEIFRKGATHFALVVEADENVIGFLTMEDVLEVVVGDIQDEYKKVEKGILTYKPGKILARGDIPLFKIERALNIDLENVEAETVAGLVYEVLDSVPQVDDVLEFNNLKITIKKMKGPKILLAKIIKIQET